MLSNSTVLDSGLMLPHILPSRGGVYFPAPWIHIGPVASSLMWRIEQRHLVQVPTWGFYFGSEIAFPTAQPILLDLGSTNFICKEPNMLAGETKLKVESFETKSIFWLFYSTSYRFLKSSGGPHRFLHWFPKICPIRLLPQHHVSRWTVLPNPVS